MKKTSIVFIFLGMAVSIWLLWNKKMQPMILTTPSLGTNQVLQQAQNTNLVENAFNTSVITQKPSKIVTAVVEPINALTATNLEQWKTAIKGLTRLGGIQFNQDWIYEQHYPDRSANRNGGIPIILNQNGKAITFISTFINLATKNGSDNDLLEIELYSPNMNIDETRELGLQLCEMLQVDPKNFLAWCDKVGNNWLDQPLFGDGNRYYSFHLLHSFNEEKPWFINFMITPNP